MSKLRANNRYSTKLMSSFDPSVDTTMIVASLPTEFPTLVTLGFGTSQEVTYRVSGSSGDNTLTGLTLFKGEAKPFFEGTTVDCVNWAEFFNQFTDLSVTYIGYDTTDYETFDNVYSVSVSDAGFDYNEGTILYYAADQTNTGAISISVNEMPAKQVLKAGDTQFTAGDITPGQTMMMLYDGTAFQLLSAISNESLEQRVDNLETGFNVATPAATVTFNMTQKNLHSLTLDQNTILAVAEVQVGRRFTIILTQDSVGSRTVTWWEGIKWVGGLAPALTTTPEKSDTFVFICVGEGEYHGYIAGMGL